MADSIFFIFSMRGWFSGVSRNGRRHAGPRPRRDAVGAHVELRHVERDRLRQSHDAHLGGAVIGLAEVADQARGRGHVHVCAGVLILEMRGRRARHEERAVQMHVDDRLPFLQAHVEEEAIAHDAGVVDDTVDAAEAYRARPRTMRSPDCDRRRCRAGGGVATGRRDLLARPCRRPHGRASASLPTSLTTTLAPLAAKASAKSRPMPLPEPVTTATLPFSMSPMISPGNRFVAGSCEQLCE